VYQLNEKQARKNAKADFSYMNAIWAPYADADSLRLMIDWHHWVRQIHMHLTQINVA
jgi:hypothetical protein